MIAIYAPYRGMHAIRSPWYELFELLMLYRATSMFHILNLTVRSQDLLASYISMIISVSIGAGMVCMLSVSTMAVSLHLLFLLYTICTSHACSQYLCINSVSV